MFSDHAALKYLLSRKDAKACLIRWILLLQEFDLEIRDKKSSENVVAYHLSRRILESSFDSIPISEFFPNEKLMNVSNYLSMLIWSTILLRVKCLLIRLRKISLSF